MAERDGKPHERTRFLEKPDDKHGVRHARKLALSKHALRIGALALPVFGQPVERVKADGLTSGRERRERAAGRASPRGRHAELREDAAGGSERDSFHERALHLANLRRVKRGLHTPRRVARSARAWPPRALSFPARAPCARSRRPRTPKARAGFPPRTS